MKTSVAMSKAKLVGLDLVEVAPNASPPVCRIVDFGKFRYELAKQEKSNKHAGSKLKELKFRVKIAEHDYMTKVKRGENFLLKGDKLRIQLQFRGRENAHVDLGFKLMDRVKEDFMHTAQVEMQPRKQGRAISMVISPLPVNQRKRRWTEENEVFDEEETEELEVAETEERDSSED